MFKKKRGADESAANVIVTSDTAKQKSDRHLAPLAPRPSLFSKRNTSALILVALLVLIGAGWFVVHRIQSAHTAAIKERDSLIDQSASYLAPQDSAKLKPIVNKLLVNDTATNDPSSLYVIATYYVNLSAVNNADSYLDKLEKLKPAADDYRASIQPQVEAKSVAALRKDVQFAKSLSGQSLDNSQQWDVKQ